MILPSEASQPLACPSEAVHELSPASERRPLSPLVIFSFIIRPTNSVLFLVRNNIARCALAGKRWKTGVTPHSYQAKAGKPATQSSSKSPPQEGWPQAGVGSVRGRGRVQNRYARSKSAIMSDGGNGGPALLGMHRIELRRKPCEELIICRDSQWFRC